MTDCRYFGTTRNGSHSSILTLILFGGRCPLPCQMFAESDPPFEKQRLRQIFAHNVSTVRDSEKSSITMNRKSITGFPTSYRWSAYVTLSLLKCGSKSDFCVFSKSQLQSNKVCYKVSLCEYFHRQRCSTAIPLSNGP